MRDPDYDKLSEIVFRVLFESKINEFPINMVGLCQSRRIKIKYLPDEDMREGCCQVHEGKPYIFIKRNGLRRRKRFTIAHELGHIMLGHIEACKTEEIERSVFRRSRNAKRMLLQSGYSLLCVYLKPLGSRRQSR